jgi:hypothetical protein
MTAGQPSSGRLARIPVSLSAWGCGYLVLMGERFRTCSGRRTSHPRDEVILLRLTMPTWAFVALLGGTVLLSSSKPVSGMPIPVLGSDQCQVRPVSQVRPPLHDMPGGIRLMEELLPFEQAMKTLGPSEGLLPDSIPIHRLAPVYVVRTRYSQPFTMGARSFRAGIVTTITNACTGVTFYSSGPLIRQLPVVPHN